MRPDLVGGTGDVVTARGGQVAHGHHYGFAIGLRCAHFAVDLLRGEHAAARAVDADHDGVHVVILARRADQFGGRFAAHGSRRL
jgi:hypothetical protein